MRRILSRWNRQRLYRRHERAQNASAQDKLRDLSEVDRDDIRAILAQFKPLDCGFDLIRVGPAFDGGYLLPDDFEDVHALYSPGVDETVGFDLEISRRGISCFLADGTVERPKNMAANMQFQKMMIGSVPKEGWMTLEAWISSTATADNDLLLQMDIEGAEYDVLTTTPRTVLDRFRLIAIELHQLDELLLGPDRGKLAAFMSVLTENHVICHLHPNNVAAPVDILGKKVPPILELSLVRKDRVTTLSDTQAPYPHPLDAINDDRYPAGDWPAFW